MPAKDYRIHEVSFCADVSKWADAWFQNHAELPFGDSDIESFAKGSDKRSDLRFYERKPGKRGKLLLMGEVKVSGTVSATGKLPVWSCLLTAGESGANMTCDAKSYATR